MFDINKSPDPRECQYLTGDNSSAVLLLTENKSVTVFILYDLYTNTGQGPPYWQSDTSQHSQHSQHSLYIKLERWHKTLKVEFLFEIAGKYQDN